MYLFEILRCPPDFSLAVAQNDSECGSGLSLTLLVLWDVGEDADLRPYGVSRKLLVSAAQSSSECLQDQSSSWRDACVFSAAKQRRHLR